MTRQTSRLLPAVVLLAAAAAVVYACTDYLLTAPEERAAKRDVTPPQFSVVGGDSGMVGTDQFTLPTPPTNKDMVPWTGTGIQVEEGRAVRVTANGILTAVENPERDLLPTPRTPLPGGLTAGPAGWIGLNGGEHVQVRLRRPNETLLTVGLAPQDQTAESIVGYVQGPGGIEVTRQPIMGGAASCIFNPGPNQTCSDGGCPHGACVWYAADYLITGTQTVTVEALDPAIVTAVPTVVDTGEAVDFEVTVPWTEDFSVAPNLPWTWVPDVGSAIRPPGSPENGCGTYKTCRYEVRRRGHMFLRVGAYGIAYDVESPTIEVRPDTSDGSDTTDVTIFIDAETANPDLSFTAKAGEDVISLHATVTPGEFADSVQWSVEATPGYFPSPNLPGPLNGAEVAFAVEPLSVSRWPAVHEVAVHPDSLASKQLSYRISAVVTANGETHHSDTVEVTQDETDTAREEYVEFRLPELTRRPIPERYEFIPESPAFPGVNGGDYQVMVFNAEFANDLSELKNVWAVLGSYLPQLPFSNFGAWQINSIYRSPVHNRLHAGGALTSWHQYHCAADLQVFPARVDGSFPTPYHELAAEDFHRELMEIAESLHFRTEPRVASGIGHVHVHKACR